MSKPNVRLPKAPAQPTRKHLARIERERRLRRWLIGSAAALFAIVLGLIAYPLVIQQLIQPGQPVAVVNGVEITTRRFQQQVRLARASSIRDYWQLQQYGSLFGDSSQLQQQIGEVIGRLNSSFAMGRDVLDEMIKDEILRQEAARRGVSVSPEEIDRAIRENLGYYPEGTPTPLPTGTLAPTSTRTATPDSATATSAAATSAAEATATPAGTDTPEATATEAATAGPTATVTLTPTASPIPSITPTPTQYTQGLYDRNNRDFLLYYRVTAGMSEADVRRLFETIELRRKLSEVWEATPEVSSVRARHILVEDEATARDIIAQLQAGGNFAALAAEFSTDTSNKDNAGDLGFFGKGQMVAEFEAAAFDNPIGLAPDPVQTTFGWHVIEIMEKRNEEMDQARDRALTEWLDQQREDPNVVQTFDYWEDRVPEDPDFDPQVPPTPFPTSAP